MQPQTINPDVIIQNTINAKLKTYQAKEHFETVLAQYNTQLDNMVNLVSFMKNRIIELEGSLDRSNTDSEKPQDVPLEPQVN